MEIQGVKKERLVRLCESNLETSNSGHAGMQENYHIFILYFVINNSYRAFFVIKYFDCFRNKTLIREGIY